MTDYIITYSEEENKIAAYYHNPNTTVVYF